MPRIVYELTTTGGVQVARLFDQIAVAAQRSQSKMAASFSGGEINRMFEGVGAAASTSMRKVEHESHRAGVGLKLVSSSMGELQRASHEALHHLGPVGTVLGSLSHAGVAGAAVAGISAVAAAAFIGAKHAADFADALEDSARAIGVSAHFLEEYQYAARQTSVDTDKLANAFKLFGRQFGLLQLGSGNLSKLLDKIDPEFKRLLQTTPDLEKGLELVIKKISSLDSVQQQAVLSQTAFGRSGKDLVALFALGDKGLQELIDQWKKLGPPTEAALQAGSKASDSFSRLGSAIHNKLVNSFLTLAPAMQGATEKLIKFLEWTNKPVDIVVELQTEHVDEQLEALEKKLTDLHRQREAINVNVAEGGGSAFRVGAGVAALTPLIEKAANIAQVSSRLVQVVMQRESGGNMAAVSDKGAIGAMQLMPATFEELRPQIEAITGKAASLTDAFDNILAGALYLAKAMKETGGNIAKTGEYYYGGPGGVGKSATAEYGRDVSNKFYQTPVGGMAGGRALLNQREIGQTEGAIAAREAEQHAKDAEAATKRSKLAREQALDDLEELEKVFPKARQTEIEELDALWLDANDKLVAALKTGALTEKEYNEEKLKYDRNYIEKRQSLVDADQSKEKQERDKKLRDLDHFTDQIAQAGARAASAGLSGAEQHRAQAEEAIKLFAREVHERVTDSAEADTLIADFREKRMAEAEQQIQHDRVETAKKDLDREKEVVDRVAAMRRDVNVAGLGGAEKIRADAERDIGAFEVFTRERVKDATKADQYIAEFRKATFERAEQEIGKFHDDQTDKRLQNEEQAARKSAQEQEQMAREFQGMFRGVGTALGDSISSGLLGAEGQAKDTTDVIRTLFAGLANDLASMFLEKQIFEPLSESFTAGSKGGGGILGGLKGLFGGGAHQVIEGPSPGVGPGAPIFKDTGLSAVSDAADSASSSILGMAGAAVAVAGTLYTVSQGIASGRSDISKASYGQNAPGNAYTGVAAINTAAFVGGGAVTGAAVGAAGFGVGALVGAAVGAAVGGAIATALNKSMAGAISGGITSGVAKGLDQAGLDRTVRQKLSSDPVVTALFPVIGESIVSTILSGGMNQVLGGMLTAAFTPDIERIFEKIFRQRIGGVGGFSTAGIGIDAQGFSGLRRYGPQAAQAGQIIGQAIGAGGEALDSDRIARYERLLLATTKREVKKSSDDAALVLSEIFTTAFSGSFLDALAAVQLGPKGGRAKGREFAAQQFGRAAGNYGFDYQIIADVVARQGRVPTTVGEGGKGEGTAVKASREGFKNAFTAALSDAADSSVFRKSMAKSVEEAFTGKAAQVLDKAFGSLFAPFFALSKEGKKEFRRERRRGDFPGALGTLSDEFLSNVADFAKVVTQPAFGKAMTDLADAILKLDVASSVAADDTRAAADAIEGRLAPAIQLVKDTAQLGRDVRSRSALALAGPGFAGDRANITELRRLREETEGRFNARYGGLGGPEGGAGTLNQLRIDSQQLGHPLGALQDPRQVLDDLREFADARLSELEAEIALARQMEEFFAAAEKSFHDMKEAAQVGLGTRTDDLDTKVVKAYTTGLKNIIAAWEDPALVAEFQQALGDAINQAISDMSAFDALTDQFKEIGRTIDQALGKRDTTTRIKELFGELDLDVSAARKRQLTPEELTKSAGRLQEATGLVTQRKDFFKGAAEDFESFAESANVARRGKRGQRDLLASRRAEISDLLRVAKGGGEGSDDALARLRQLLPEALSLGQSVLSGGRFRSLAAELERAGVDLAAFSKDQVSVADKQLTALEAIAALLGVEAEDGKKHARNQLELLEVIAAEAEGAAGTARAKAEADRIASEAELKDFRDKMLPMITYLQGQAGAKLSDDFNRLAALLDDGPDGKIYKVLGEVRDRLPAARAFGGSVNAGQMYLVGERGREWFVPNASGAVTTSPPQVSAGQVTVQGPFVFQFQNAPRTDAEAREMGRGVADAFTERIVQVLARTQLKQVA